MYTVFEVYKCIAQRLGVLVIAGVYVNIVHCLYFVQ